MCENKMNDFERLLLVASNALCEACDLIKKQAKTEEVLKHYDELSLGEKYVLFLLNNDKEGKITPENVIMTAEKNIVNDKLLDFLANQDKSNFVFDMISELMNTLYKVNTDKIRNKPTPMG